MKNTPERKPKKIFFHKSFDFNHLPSGCSEDNIHNGNTEYIRKDISEAKEKEAYKKGSNDCHKAFVSSGYFTKEQVIEISEKAALYVAGKIADWTESGEGPIDTYIFFKEWIEQEKSIESK